MPLQVSIIYAQISCFILCIIGHTGIVVGMVLFVIILVLMVAVVLLVVQRRRKEAYRY